MSYTGNHTQQTEKKMKRREKRAAYFYDMSKILLGGTVLTFLPAVVLEGHELDGMVLYTFVPGIVSTILTAVIGDMMMEY